MCIPVTTCDSSSKGFLLGFSHIQNLSLTPVRLHLCALLSAEGEAEEATGVEQYPCLAFPLEGEHVIAE